MTAARSGTRNHRCPLAHPALLSLVGSFAIVRRRRGVGRRHAVDRVDIQRGKTAKRGRNDGGDVDATHATHQKIGRLKREAVALQLNVVVDLK